YRFAGMQNGNECWCGEYAGRKKTGAEMGYMDAESWARNQSECTIPCSGDESKFCGGKDLLAGFDTEDHEPYSSLSSMGVSTGASTSTSAAVGTMTSTSIATNTTGVDAPGASETRASSGAVRNLVVPWSFVVVLSMALFS
ncbi:hypothetical protein B0H65DRAFT_424863, partial [Neurospora tetraspora]